MTLETVHIIDEEPHFTVEDEAFLHTIGARATVREIRFQPQEPTEEDERSGGSTIITHPDHPINQPDEDD